MTKALAKKQNGLMTKLGTRFGVDGDKLYDCLKDTAFKGGANDSQMMALMVVADQYGLNPFTKEIYAFPDKRNGIVPVVGVDGWSRIINSHEQYDGMDFEQDAESCTCIIHRKDRNHPTRATEYLEECERDTGPWKSHPKRMMRHKAMIQCARLAFGYVGIYDQDEAERILEGEINVTPKKEPFKMPKMVSEPTPEPEQEQEPEVLEVTGILEEVQATPTKKKGKRYGLRVAKKWYGTFSKTIGTKAEKLEGKEICLGYIVEGDYMTVDTLALVTTQEPSDKTSEEGNAAALVDEIAPILEAIGPEKMAKIMTLVKIDIEGGEAWELEGVEKLEEILHLAKAEKGE